MNNKILITILLFSLTFNGYFIIKDKHLSSSSKSTNIQKNTNNEETPLSKSECLDFVEREYENIYLKTLTKYNGLSDYKDYIDLCKEESIKIVESSMKNHDISNLKDKYYIDSYGRTIKYSQIEQISSIYKVNYEFLNYDDNYFYYEIYIQFNNPRYPRDHVFRFDFEEKYNRESIVSFKNKDEAEAFLFELRNRHDKTI